jgi:predicted  nucleic acid-binding Zn-ribbon protein
MLGIQGLIKLSQIDHEIRLILKEIETADDGSSIVTEIENLKKIVSQGDAILKKTKDAVEDNRLALEKTSVEKSKLEKTIFEPNNSAKRIEELNSHKIKLEKFIDELETKSLELMENLDKTTEKLAKAKKILESKKAQYDAKSGEFKQFKLKGEIKMADLQRNRDALRPKISKDLVAIYDKLMQSKQGVAMAEIVGNQCMGCNQTIPSVLLQALRDDPEDVHFCSNCSRLIYIWRQE